MGLGGPKGPDVRDIQADRGVEDDVLKPAWILWGSVPCEKCMTISKS